MVKVVVYELVLHEFVGTQLLATQCGPLSAWSCDGIPDPWTVYKALSDEKYTVHYIYMYLAFLE